MLHLLNLYLSIGCNSMVFSIHSSSKFTRVFNLPLFFLHDKNEFEQIIVRTMISPVRTQKLHTYAGWLSHDDTTSRNKSRKMAHTSGRRKKIFRNDVERIGPVSKYSKVSKISQIRFICHEKFNLSNELKLLYIEILPFLRDECTRHSQLRC